MPTIVRLPFDELPDYEAASVLLAMAAYPNQLDASERERYRVALCRFAILQRAKLEPEWGKKQLSIRPVIFSQEETLFHQTLARGQDLLFRHSMTAFVMLHPFLTSLKNPESPNLLLANSVKHRAMNLAHLFGMSTGSYKTVEARDWASTKPVAHVAFAIITTSRVFEQAETVWNDDHRLCSVDFQLAVMFYRDVCELVLSQAKEAAADLLKADLDFKITDDEIIQFVI